MDRQLQSPNIPLNIHPLDFNTDLKIGPLIKNYHIPEAS